jgi:hypothetical protein
MHPHVDIESELRRLQDLLPMLVARLPAEEVLAAFAAEADSLAGLSSPVEIALVRERIARMLARAGLLPEGAGPDQSAPARHGAA